MHVLLSFMNPVKPMVCLATVTALTVVGPAGSWRALSQTATTNLTAIQSPPTNHAMQTFQKPPPDELKQKLTPMQYSVTQRAATEPAFHNEFWNYHKAGIYVDIVSGQPLFSSLDKFDSGCGWPSFSRALATNDVVERPDHSAGMERIEVRSGAADSHLGHVFNDGPAPTGMRYCMNSVSLRFVRVG